MSVAAGDELTGPRLNPVSFQLQCNATVNLGAAADLSMAIVTPGYGTGTSFVVPEGGMVGLAVWAADLQLTTGGAVTAATVDLLIDGVVPANAPEAVWDPGNTTDGRATVFASWPLALAAGSHSFGLRGAAVLAAPAVVRVNSKHTNLTIFLHP